MNLIGPVMAGIAGAEQGTVEVYRRGTSTRASYYTDFEANGLVSTGDDVVLDSNGRAEVYVNELCDVIVKDRTGQVVCDFTIGESAPNVEYRGQGFTGVAYDTAASGAGAAYPVSLQAILDLWKTTNGSIDWKVLSGSSSVTIKGALSSVMGMFYNVKDTTYGAVGDGATDDAAAINAAISAATAAGGIVFFPPGTYAVKSAITLLNRVSLWGCGVNSSKLSIDHATAGLLNITAANSRYQEICGLTFQAKQANTGALVTVGTSSNILMRNCALGLTNANGILVSGTSMGSGSSFRAEYCDFNPSASTKEAFSGLSGYVTFVGCRLTPPASYTPTSGGMIYANTCTIIGCEFDNSSATAGTFACFKANTTSIVGSITGCRFLSGGGATVTYIALGTYSASAKFVESDNTFGSDTAYSYTFASAAKGADVRLVTREMRKTEVTNDSTSANLALDQYGIIVVKRTTNGDQTFYDSTGIGTNNPPEGSTGSIFLWNGSGGNIALANVGQPPFYGQGAAGAVNNNVVALWRYASLIVSTTPKLRVFIDRLNVGSP